MNTLPQSWLRVSLKDICDIQMGQSPDSSTYNEAQHGLPFFQGKAEFGKTFPTVKKWCTDPKKVAEKGDVLLSIRAPVGPSNVADQRCAIGRGLAAIGAIEPINNRYIFYFIRSIENWLGQQGTGSTFAAISGDFVRAIETPLAPLPEQKRIADKLDTVLARVDSCRDRLDRLPALLKRFRQSILAAATSGRLTEDWRTNTECSTWGSTTLDSVAKFIDYRGKTPVKTSSGIPLITAKNVRPGYVSFEPQEFIAETAYDTWMTRGFPRKGDVLITTEAPLGYVAVITWDYKFALAQRVICLQFSSSLVGVFAAIAMQSDAFQEKLINQSTGSTVSGIKASRLKELEIPVPSLPEQHEIVRRVDTLFAFADRLEARLATARQQVDQLTPALLAKAFRGELVPQDPADEPASELLKRLAAQRVQTDQAPKPKRGRKAAQ